jgi:hypothetical protein
MLAEIYSWFTEGFDTRDLKEAKTLLNKLNAQPLFGLPCLISPCCGPLNTKLHRAHLACYSPSTSIPE